MHTCTHKHTNTHIYPHLHTPMCIYAAHVQNFVFHHSNSEVECVLLVSYSPSSDLELLREILTLTVVRGDLVLLKYLINNQSVDVNGQYLIYKKIHT